MGEDAKNENGVIEKEQNKTVENVNMKKVKKYIKKVGKFVKENPNPSDWSQHLQEFMDIENSINLNDDEYLEVQKIMLKEFDLKYNGGLTPVEGNNFDASKFWTFYIANARQLKRWEEKRLTKEEIIMTKIMPIIRKTNNELKTQWIIKLGDLIKDIKNQKLSLSSKNREKINDELIKLFSDKKSPEMIRISATKAWISGERRENKIYNSLNILLQDEVVFKEIARFLTHLAYCAPKLYDKMFSILENRNKYSEKILNGALEFLIRDSISYKTKKEIKRVKRYMKILSEIKKENWSNIIKNKALKELELDEKRLKSFKNKEKRGEYK
ncbi:hypothetical protein J7L48_01810 [bacterium]|nr:hypothetical protein [bacterium]